MTTKLNIVKEQSNAIYDAGNQIIQNKIFLKSNLCDYNDVYIWVRGGYPYYST